MTVRTYYGVHIYPAGRDARVRGWRWEVLGCPGRPFVVVCETLADARRVIREAVR